VPNLFNGRCRFLVGSLLAVSGVRLLENIQAVNYVETTVLK